MTEQSRDSNNQGIWRNETLLKLGFVSFLADVASEMLYPITPIFLTMVLGTSMTSVGLVEGVADGLAGILKTLSGAHSDSIRKRKPFIVLGYFLAALAKPLIGLAHHWNTVLMARAIDRTGKGLRTAPRDALIAESVSPTQRGIAFGWHRTMDTMGAAIGPLVTLAYLEFFGQNFRPLYFFAMVPGLAAVLLSLSLNERKGSSLFSPSPSPSFSHAPTVTPIDLGSIWNLPFILYLVAWSTFAIANASDAFILLRAKEMSLDIKQIIFVYCAFNLTYSLLSTPLGALSDRWGRRPLMIAGLLLFAMVNIGFGFATEAWQLWLAYLAYGVFMAATEGIGKALVVDMVPRELKATGLGVFGTITGICTLLASVITGLLWDHFGSSIAFIYAATGSVLAASLFLIKTKIRPLHS